MYYYHSEFFHTGQCKSHKDVNMNGVAEDEMTLLPSLGSKEVDSDMRKWLQDRRANRKSSADANNIDSSLITPMGRSNFTESLTESPSSIKCSPSGDRPSRTGEANERMEKWLKHRQSIKVHGGPLDILAAISPIRSTDDSQRHGPPESFPKDNSNSLNSSALASASAEPHPPSNSPNSVNATRTALARMNILHSLCSPNSHRSIDKSETNESNRPRSFYKEYVETQRKRDLKGAEGMQVEEASNQAEQPQEVNSDADRMATPVGTIELPAIVEDDEEDSDENDEFDTGAAASALLRMKELHQEEARRIHNNNGQRLSKVNNKHSLSGKRGLSLRKNSEANNTPIEDMLMGRYDKKQSSRKNSEAHNEIESDVREGSRSIISKPPPARSQRTVMKRFEDGKTDLKQKLSEKELVAKQQLQARLEKRNKIAAEIAAKRRESEKGWK